MSIKRSIRDHLSDFARAIQKHMHDTISSYNDKKQSYVSLKIHTTDRSKSAKEKIKEHEHNYIIEYHRNHLYDKRCPIRKRRKDIEFPYLKKYFKHVYTIIM